MKMTYIDPNGNKVQAVPADSQNIPVVNIAPEPQTNDLKTQTQLQPVKLNIDSATEFRQFIEVEVLKIIKELSEKQQMTHEKAKVIAKTTLDLIKPEMDIETLFQNAVKLDDQLPELSPVVYKIMREYEEKYEKKALTQVSQMIKKGRYQEAQELVKRVLAYKAIK